MTLLLVGKSGTGKSTSLRNLELENLVYVNAEAKDIPFRGSNRIFKNIIPKSTVQVRNGMEQMEEIDDKLTIVTDSISMLMDMFYIEYIKDAVDSRSGWGAYKDYFMELISFAKRSKHDYVFTALAKDTYNEKELVTETFASVQGSLFKAIESHFSVVLHTVITEEGGQLQHKFITNKDARNLGLSCKSPIGMFDETYIDNDVALAFELMEKYYNE